MLCGACVDELVWEDWSVMRGRVSVVGSYLAVTPAKMFVNTCRHLPGFVLASPGLCDVYAWQG